jgi:hypothetical protein
VRAGGQSCCGVHYRGRASGAAAGVVSPQNVFIFALNSTGFILDAKVTAKGSSDEFSFCFT